MAIGWRGQYYKYREFSINLLAIYRQRSDVQAFLEIILSLTTIIIFTVFALKPTILTMISLTKEIKTKKETLAILNQKISDLQTANNIYINQQSKMPIIDSAVPTVPQPDVLAKQLYGLATKNSVTVTNISIDKTLILGNGSVAKAGSENLKPLPKNAQSMPVTINVKADYKNLLLFLKDIESFRIPINIDGLLISMSKLESGTILTELITGRAPFLGKQN